MAPGETLQALDLSSKFAASLAGALSLRNPSKANTDCTTPHQTHPVSRHPAQTRSLASACPPLQSTPAQSLSVTPLPPPPSPSCSKARHTSSCPVSPACSLEPSHPVPPSLPERVAALAHGLLDFYGFSDFLVLLTAKLVLPSCVEAIREVARLVAVPPVGRLPALPCHQCLLGSR